MSKKHFVALARALQSRKPDGVSQVELGQWQRDCEAVANVCEEMNERFDTQRFLTACGV